MRSHSYPASFTGDDPRVVRRRVAEVPADPGLVVEEVTSGFCGAVLGVEKGPGGALVALEDRHGVVRRFPLLVAGFAIDGATVTLIRATTVASAAPRRTASGSIAVESHRARVAREGRIYVEGLHDAALVEKVWGHDLRVEGVVVEPLDGIDDLAAIVRGFQPGSERRLGVLVDHLVTGTKESRIVAEVTSPHVLVTGHPYVDIWQAVKPRALGVPAWPVVPRGEDWKTGICTRMGWSDPPTAWRKILGSVSSYADLETPLLGAVERLIDFVTDPG